MREDIEQAVKALADEASSNLLTKLGAYTVAFPAKPDAFVAPSAAAQLDASVAGPLDDALDLGKRILRRWQRTMYDLVCGGGDVDPDDRKTILDAIHIASPEALSIAITTVLISSFSVAPAIAAVVGVLFGKLLLPAAGKQVCAFWKERL